MAEEKETETIKKKQSKEKDGNEKENELFENILRIVKETSIVRGVRGEMQK